MNLIDRCPGGVKPILHLAFVVDEPLVSHFFMLLQQGVTVRSRVGQSVTTYLREEIGTSPATIEKIQSVILDGKPVDDLDSAWIKDGSVLALSAAMPGLVGATLRRGGAYSLFRSAITYRETGQECFSGEGFVRIKLFNLLMAELGPNLLRKGVILRSEEFLSSTAERSKSFWEGCRRITLDGKHADVSMLQEASWLSGNDQIVLSISSSQV
ncbi:MAG TPA: hypothetical protein VL122_13675 [Nitrospirota bacterium]|nr:hypothetical protein [Nitrospirota bacterium]